MFEFLKNIANKIGSFFTKTIPKTFHAVSHWVSTNIIKPVSNTVSSVVKAVHQDARDVVSGATTLITHTQDNFTGLATTTVHDIKDLGKTVADDTKKIASSLAMPVAIAGVAGLAIFLMMKK